MVYSENVRKGDIQERNRTVVNLPRVEFLARKGKVAESPNRFVLCACAKSRVSLNTLDID